MTKMFAYCTSLTAPPTLPATSLAANCYQGMFYGCTSLATAPALPATTLKWGCYAYMFYGCTSLTTSPILPAAELVTSCYYQMFYGCSSLSRITCYNTIVQVNSLSDWVYGVAANGTFIKAASVNNWPTGASGIPNGWNVVSASTVTIDSYGVFIDHQSQNSSITSVTLQYTIKIIATPEPDDVARTETYQPVTILQYNAGTAYPVVWNSYETNYSIRNYAPLVFYAPGVADGYGTDLHVVIETNVNQTGVFCTFNNGSTVYFQDIVTPYQASYFKINGVFPVVMAEEYPCCLDGNHIDSEQYTYISG